jgi:hypothetical protein
MGQVGVLQTGLIKPYKRPPERSTGTKCHSHQGLMCICCSEPTSCPPPHSCTSAGGADYGSAASSSDYSASDDGSASASSQRDWPERPPERKTGTIPKATKGIVDALSPAMIGRIVKTMGPGMTSRILNVLGE